VEGLATKLPERVVGDAAYSLATLPQRALAAADRFHRTGEYDPAPIVEAATLMVGAPLTPKGALGSSAQRLPMDRASVEARMRQMNMAEEPFYRAEGSILNRGGRSASDRVPVRRLFSRAIDRPRRQSPAKQATAWSTSIGSTLPRRSTFISR